MKIEYAKIIPGLKIKGEPAPYPVVNEREVRAGAGIMFLIGFFTLMYTVLTKDFRIIYFIIPLFTLDFFLKTFLSANLSIFGFLGKIITSKQEPEYVGAIQKRFAWGIGFVFASTVLLLVIVFNIRGIVPLSFCSVCLFFMWLESACGICVGCSIYNYLLKYNLVKAPRIKPACPGGACSIK